jgi:hypothetical protein
MRSGEACEDNDAEVSRDQDLGAWPEMLPPEARGLLGFLLSQEILAKALQREGLIEVRGAGSPDADFPLFPDAVLLDVVPAAPRGAHARVERIKDGRSCILLRNVLQLLPDYRRFLAACFAKLATGGMLVIIVPHQFLYERKLQPPSRHNRANLRFYTSGALLAEVEEALDPCQFRVRALTDNDSGFDYGAPLDRAPSAGCEVVLCLERIGRPNWRDAMEEAEMPAPEPSRDTRFLPALEPANWPYRVVAPDPLAARITRIIILKLDHHGDFILAREAFRIIRHAFPDAAITLVCGSWNLADAKGLGLFGDVLAFDFFREDTSEDVGTAVSFDELSRRFVDVIDQTSYDLAIDFRLYQDTRELLRLIDARHRAGFDPYDTFPWLTIRLSPYIPTSDGRAERQMVTPSRFLTSVGDHCTSEVLFEGCRCIERQYLVYGPYIGVKPGRYDFEFLVTPLAHEFELFYDVVANNGTVLLGGGTLKVEKGRYPRISLYAAEPIEGLECRLMTRREGEVPPFRFAGLQYTRHGAHVGTTQFEAMALLAHFIPLRLRQPFTSRLY